MSVLFEVRGKGYGVTVFSETPGFGSGPCVELLVDEGDGFLVSSRFYFNAEGLPGLIEVLERAQVVLEDKEKDFNKVAVIGWLLRPFSAWLW